MKLPNQKFAVILADPPWHFKTWSEKGEDRGAVKHYPVMSLKEIKALDVASIAADDCVLLLWATMPMLPEALEVIKAWGFKYKTVAFTWMKQNRKSATLFIEAEDIFMGGGYWTRANCELCILATRGKPKRIHADVPQAIFSPVREHSRKPDVVYERIERLLGDVPRIELFARTQLPGWQSVGNQINKFRTPLTGQRGDSQAVKTKPQKRKAHVKGTGRKDRSAGR